MWKKKLVLFLLAAMVIACLAGCKEEKGDTKVGDVQTIKKDTSIGEDYGDKRESKWELKDSDDKGYVTVKASKGYALAAQSYSNVSIAKRKDSGDVQVVADVQGYAGTSLKETVEMLTQDKSVKASERKDGGYEIVTGKDSDVHLIILGNDNNAVVVRMSEKNFADAGLVYKDAVSDIISMIKF